MQCRHLIPALKVVPSLAIIHDRIDWSYMHRWPHNWTYSFYLQAALLMFVACFFGTLSMSGCTTRHWQTSGRLVQELNVCTVYGFEINACGQHTRVTLSLHSPGSALVHWHGADPQATAQNKRRKKWMNNKKSLLLSFGSVWLRTIMNPSTKLSSNPSNAKVTFVQSSRTHIFKNNNI